MKTSSGIERKYNRILRWPETPPCRAFFILPKKGITCASGILRAGNFTGAENAIRELYSIVYTVRRISARATQDDELQRCDLVCPIPITQHGELPENELCASASAAGFSSPFCFGPAPCQPNPYPYAIRKERPMVFWRCAPWMGSCLRQVNSLRSFMESR